MDESERRVRARGEATEWWLSVESGDFPAAHRERFVRWLRESPIHVEEMLRVAQVHKELVRFDAWQDISTENSIEDTIVEFPSAISPEVDTGARRPQGRISVGAWAASLLVVVIAAAWL